MDNREINKELRQKAIGLGLCEQWQGQWAQDWDESKMIAKYKEGIDFCLANNFPTNDFIKSQFSLDALRKGGVFVSDKYSVMDRRYFVVKGNSNIRARYNGSNIGEAYVTDDSVLRLSAKNQCHVTVHILDHATVIAEQYDKARILLIRHSPQCEIITNGDVVIKDEFDWLK